MRNILIYRNDLLPLSETFIRAQAAAMQRHQPHFVGVRATTPSLLDAADVLLADDHSGVPHSMRRVAHQYLGAAPLLHTATFLQKLRDLQPALMHAHFATDAVAALPLAVALDVPLIVTLHGYDVTVRPSGRNPLRRWAMRHGSRTLGRYASLFLCVSDFIRCQAIAAGYPAEKLLVHHIGIDTETFHPAPLDAMPQVSSHTILFVGRLTEKKGCEYLIRAMAQIHPQYPSAQLIIVGDGALRASLEQLAHDLGVPAHFTGPLSHDAVRNHIATARTLVFPSVTAKNGDSEGLGMVLLEAQGMGVPVVATRHAGTAEGLIDGQAGLLSDERDVAGLARNIARLLQDDSLHADLSCRGAEMIQRGFDLQHQTAHLESIYDAVLARRVVVPLNNCCNARATL